MKKTRVRTYLIDGIIVDVYHRPRVCEVHMQPPPAGHWGWRETRLYYRATKLGGKPPKLTKTQVARIVRRQKNRQKTYRNRLLP